jgi:tRNA(Ile)-lysidine synthase
MGRAVAVKQFELRVRAALEESGLTGGKRLVVAVSGGPDSLSMLHSLVNLSCELGLLLHGAHLDHGLRGASSEADAHFVSEAFGRLGIEYTAKRADVASFRSLHRLSLEEAARQVRYRFLARVAAEQRADAVAVGHTADDQAETVLMHILRGTGITGLRGMEPLAHHVFGGKRVVLARPLLRLSRQSAAEYCAALGLSPRLDESNLSLEPVRNRVRLELLPALKRYNPSVREALLRLSRSAAADLAYLDSQANAVWNQAVRVGSGHVALKRKVFHQLAPALQTHLLRRGVSQLKGDLDGFEHIHFVDMARLMAGPAGRMLHLPGGIRFSVGYEDASLSFGQEQPNRLPVLEGEHALMVPGETPLPGWRVTAFVRELGPSSPADLFRGEGGKRSETSVSQGGAAEFVRSHGYSPDGLRAVLSYGALGDRLHVRARAPGDRFQPLGMARHKKLQDFMVDEKIPRPCRDRIPLLLSSRGIAWVVGWRIAHWARARDSDRRLLETVFVPEEAAGSQDL